VEIERKWLVAGAPPPEALDVPEATIEQGYLVTGAAGSEARLRRCEGRCVLTVKSGEGLARAEHEVELTAAQFDALWPATEGRRLVKTRRRLPEGDRLVVELDVYGGALDGLAVAEVEFPDEATARAFTPPDWFGREVTDDPAYKNRRLAAAGRPPVAADG
jgi:CYTH domain-containing protein